MDAKTSRRLYDVRSLDGDNSDLKLMCILSVATARANAVFQPILDARTKAERLRSTLGVFERSKFFFNLPGILGEAVEAVSPVSSQSLDVADGSHRGSTTLHSSRTRKVDTFSALDQPNCSDSLPLRLLNDNSSMSVYSTKSAESDRAVKGYADSLPRFGDKSRKSLAISELRSESDFAIRSGVSTRWRRLSSQSLPHRTESTLNLVVGFFLNSTRPTIQSGSSSTLSIDTSSSCCDLQLPPLPLGFEVSRIGPLPKRKLTSQFSCDGSDWRRPPGGSTADCRSPNLRRKSRETGWGTSSR